MPDFITATGTINVTGALSAVEDSSDDIIVAQATIDVGKRRLLNHNYWLYEWDFDDGDYQVKEDLKKLTLDFASAGETVEFRRKVNIVEDMPFIRLAWAIVALNNQAAVRVNEREFVSGYDADPDDLIFSGPVTSASASFPFSDTSPSPGVQYLYVTYTYTSLDPSVDITCQLDLEQLRAKQTPPMNIGDGANLKYAYGSILVTGEMSEAELRPVTPLNGKGTITWLGAAMAAGYTDPNLKFALGSINVSASLDVGSPNSRTGAMSAAGALSAIGRLQKELSGSLTSERADFSSGVFVGPGTIDGQKKAIIREAFGSLEIYNNSMGGFYSVGDSQQLKEAYALINVTGSLSALGQLDQTKFATGTITATGSVVSRGTSLAAGDIDV